MKQIVAMLAAVALVLGATSSANADFKVRIDFGNNGTFEHTITDNGAGDTNSTIGIIEFSTSSGNFTVQSVLGTSKPVQVPPGLHLNSVSVTTTGGGTVAVELTDTGFTGPVSPLTLGVGGTTPNGSTLAFQGAGGVSNSEFDLSNASNANLQFFNIGANFVPFVGATTFGPTTVSPYSLTIRAVITHTGAGTTSFDAELTATPAPAGLLLAAAAVPVLGAGAWLRRRKAAQA